MSTWHSWCSDATDRPLPEKLLSLEAWCASVISAFLIAAVIGVFFLVRWIKLSSRSKSLMWPLFGW